MKCRTALVLALMVVLCSAAALVRPTGASAYIGSPDTIIENPTYFPQEWDYLVGNQPMPDPAVGEILLPAEEMAGAPLAAGGVAGLAIGSLGLGITIGTGINSYFHLSCKISSTCNPDTSGTYQFKQWVPAASLGGFGFPAGTYVAQVFVSTTNCYFATTGNFSHWKDPAQTADSCFHPVGLAIDTYANSNLRGGSVVDGLPGSGWTNEHFWLAPGGPAGDHDMSKQLVVDVAAGNPSGHTINLAVSKPTAPTTGGTTANNIQKCMAGDSSVGSQCGGISTAAKVTLAKALDPSYEGPGVTMPDCYGLSQTACDSAMSSAGFTSTSSYVTYDPLGAVITRPAGSIVTQSVGAGTTVAPSTVVTFHKNPTTLPIEWPAPETNETYDHYVARLTALGYLGSVTYVDLSDSAADPKVGPSAISRIVVNTYTSTGTSVQTLWTTAWPTTLPRTAPTTAVTVYRNPPDVPPIPGGGDGGGGTVSGPPPTPTGTLDFSPLTGLSFGCKFPYGFACYAKDVTNWFNVTPQAPDFNIPVHGPGGWSANYNVDLADSHANLDYYMSIIRAIETVIIWVGTVYILATRLLGFTAGGDPGEAIDEVFE